MGEACTVLVIEDEEGIRLLVRDFLLEYFPDMRIILASNMTKGMEFLRRMQFDIVITDGELPDGSGIEVTREAKERGIPVIFMTGNSNLLGSAAEAGADEVFLKPLDWVRIIARVRHFL